MALNIVRLNPEYIADPQKGKPISNAQIFIGEPDTDPEIISNQKPVTLQQEDGSLVTAAQPIRTSAGGMPLYGGSTVAMFVEGAYSIKVLNSLGAQEYYFENVTPQGIDTGALPSVKREIHVATALQTVFNLANAYIPGTNSLFIYVDGVFQPRASYTETGRTTITFLAGLAVGQSVEFVSGGVSTGTIEASAVGYTATGSTVSGNAGHKLDVFVSVTDWPGATDVDKFQAAIDSTANGEIQVIVVPRGTYFGDFSTLVVGTRTIVFLEMGAVVYSGVEPLVNRVFSTYSGDTTRPWFVGKYGIVSNQTSGGPTDRPVLRVQRVSDHTGGSGNNSSISSAVLVNKNGGRVDGHENAYVGQVDSYRSDTILGAPNMTVFQGVCFKHNPSSGGFFGGNFVARDQTGRQSSVSKGGLVGAEIDVVASGPDDSKRRIVAEIIARGYDASADGATSVYAGVRVRPSEGGVVSAEPVHIDNGVLVTEGTLGTIGSCFRGEGGGQGLSLSGTYTTDVINCFTDTLASVRLGSKVNTVGFETAQIVFDGFTNISSRVVYSEIRNIISTNTAGVEDGRIDLLVKAAGSDVIGVQVNGKNLNSVSVRVGGNLKPVSEGSADSAGAGFRLLMVPN